MPIHMLLGADAPGWIDLGLVECLITYWLQALVWIGLTALTVRVRSMSPAAENRLWTWALLAPLAIAPIGSVVAHLQSGAADARTPPATRGILTTLTLEPGAQSSGAAAMLVCVFAIVACVFASARLFRLVVSSARVWRRTRERERVREGRWQDASKRLLASSRFSRGVVLSHSPSLSGPMVLGTSEICLPSSLLESLDDDEVLAVLAHEIAHLERRDGVGFLALGALEVLLALQPLSAWACRRWRASAELACDDRAVELTRDPFALARALTNVASASMPTAPWMPSPTMARPAHLVLVRVRRLTVLRPTIPALGAGGGRGWLPGLVAIALLSPRLSIGAAVSPSSHVEGAPDLEQHDREMEESAELTRRMRDELDSLRRSSSAEDSDARRLALEQDLRHLEAERSWKQERIESEWHAWERRQRGAADETQEH